MHFFIKRNGVKIPTETVLDMYRKSLFFEPSTESFLEFLKESDIGTDATDKEILSLLDEIE